MYLSLYRSLQHDLTMFDFICPYISIHVPSLNHQDLPLVNIGQSWSPLEAFLHQVLVHLPLGRRDLGLTFNVHLTHLTIIYHP